MAQGERHQSDAVSPTHNSRYRFTQARDRPSNDRPERVSTRGRCVQQRRDGTVRDNTVSLAIGHGEFRQTLG